MQQVADSGKYPFLLNSTDVSNVAKIMDAHPDLFGLRWDDPKSKMTDGGCLIQKTIRSDGGSESNLYGFNFTTQQGVKSYRCFDGHIITNELFGMRGEGKRWIHSNKTLVFDADNPEKPVKEHVILGGIPLFFESINRLCEVAAEITGNNNTTKLHEALTKIDSFTTEDYDLELDYMFIDHINGSVTFGFDKDYDYDNTKIVDLINCCSEDGTNVRRSNNALLDVASDPLDSGDCNNCVVIKFDREGLSREVGISLGHHYSKLAPPETKPMDNYGRYSQKVSSHNECVSLVTSVTEEAKWFTEDIARELSTWEDETITTNLLAAIVAYGTDYGYRLDVSYGWMGPGGMQTIPGRS